MVRGCDIGYDGVTCASTQAGATDWYFFWSCFLLPFARFFAIVVAFASFPIVPDLHDMQQRKQRVKPEGYVFVKFTNNRQEK